MQSGASASIEQVRIDGGCRQILTMGGGELHLVGLSARSEGTGLMVDGQSELHLSDTVITSRGAALVLSHGSIHAERARFSAVGATGGALVTLGVAQAELTAVVIEAQGCDTALVLQGLTDGRFRDIALRGARTALRAEGASLAHLDGLTAEGLDVGIEWIGSRDPTWTWQGLSVRAPQPALGLSGIELGGSGARAEQLQTVPLLASAPH